MRSLLDVNVLVALFDEDHTFHSAAQAWISNTIDDGWASCPMTQAGFIRVLSNPRYPADVNATQALTMLAGATADPHHEFWPDDVTLTDGAVDQSHILGHNQITDIYLVALAVKHNGQFVTFDRRIDLSSVRDATVQHLVILQQAPTGSPRAPKQG